MINTYNAFIPHAQVIAPKATNGLGAPVEKTAIRKAAEEFESVFATEMLRPMMEESNDDVDPIFGGSFGEETFKSMMTDEYGKSIANAGGIGIADSIEAQMLKYQEVK